MTKQEAEEELRDARNILTPVIYRERLVFRDFYGVCYVVEEENILTVVALDENGDLKR